MKKIIWIQFFVLLAGTLFAWGNFILEMIDYLNERACSTGCAIGVVNPLSTPCFYGAIFFTLAFILSSIILKKAKKH